MFRKCRFHDITPQDDLCDTKRHCFTYEVIWYNYSSHLISENIFCPARITYQALNLKHRKLSHRDKLSLCTLFFQIRWSHREWPSQHLSSKLQPGHRDLWCTTAELHHKHILCGNQAQHTERQLIMHTQVPKARKACDVEPWARICKSCQNWRHLKPSLFECQNVSALSLSLVSTLPQPLATLSLQPFHEDFIFKVLLSIAMANAKVMMSQTSHEQESRTQRSMRQTSDGDCPGYSHIEHQYNKNIKHSHTQEKLNN